MVLEELAARRAELRCLFDCMIAAYGNKDFDEFATYLRDDTVFEWAYLPLKDFPSRMIGVQNFIEM